MAEALRHTLTDHWARAVNGSVVPVKQELLQDQALQVFLDFVSATGLTLYPAQEEAILAVFAGNNVILNTPTGSGKSLVATAMHFAAWTMNRRSYYTCPIKALVNEKFLSLCREFGADQVGMMTGDGSVNPDAKIICCTAEILANLALREGEKAEVHDVIMDEFHYYSDRERGVAWQVPLLTLPQTRFMLMSATLGEVSFFQKSLTALNQRETVVVKSNDRPVPLTFRYQETPIHETIQELTSSGKSPVYLVSFTQRECAEAAQSLLSVDLATKAEKQEIAAFLVGLGVRFSSPYGRELYKILRHGIGIHHAGLLPKYRYVVERLAQKGFLKVICGTDTLGVGVNVPIRTVLLTKLCKYDGEKTVILSVRDFHQIAGRAGRKGFDHEGFVYAQAPEHVIANQRLEAKAGGDPKKIRKVVKQKPPEKGFVLWTQETFNKLIASTPEPLHSRFQVSHGMLLQVLARPGDGCRDMRQLIRACHESDAVKERLRKLAFKMFRSLVDRQIIEFESRTAGRRKGLRINVDLQEDFSIHHALALYLIDTVKKLDPYLPTYSLDVLSLAEAIVEDPEVVLRRQLDLIKRDKIAEMKAEGASYEERMAELEHLEYPKPNREFIYATFNEFAATHPWLQQPNIRPKSVVREMYERYMTFAEYVREYELQRSEGLLLRYLTEVYKVLLQTVPDRSKDDEFQNIIEYLAVMIRQVDSTLIDEWEKLKQPGLSAPVSENNLLATSEERRADADITKNKRQFTAAIRNEVFQYLRALYNRRLGWIAENQREVHAATPWTEIVLAKVFEEYRVDHDGPLIDRNARGPQYFTTKELSDELIQVDQTLTDQNGNNDWGLTFEVDVAATRETGMIVMRLVKFSAI